MDAASSPTPIPTEVAKKQYGIFDHHECMQNGELRFRLMSTEGSGYIRTVATPNSGWQSSHKHEKLRETCVVQSGWMVLVSFQLGALHYQKLNPGDVVTTDPDVPHNVYLSPGTIIHTIKHGDVQPKDWMPYPELDKVTKGLTEADIE